MPPHVRLEEEGTTNKYVADTPTFDSKTKWPEPIEGPVGDSATGYGGGKQQSLFAKYFAYILPGPPIVSCIIFMELCERYGYYSLRSVLGRYLTNSLGFSDDEATSIALGSSSLAYFMPLIGGYISDSYLGRYNTIIIFGMIYSIGAGVLALTAWPASRLGCLLGLVMIGIGTGGIKPNVSSFGADQFTGSNAVTQTKEETEHQIASYFRMFYFCINFGSVFSFIVTPLLRDHFGYAIAFGPSAGFIVLAILVFWAGRHYYERLPPKGSILPQIFYAMKIAAKEGSVQRGETRNWRGPFARFEDLNLAVGVNGVTRDAVVNARALYRVGPIFAVLPIFWMLFEQQSNTWTFQATHMDSQGMAAETMNVFNPAFIMVLIPLCDRLIYPAIDKRINFTPLRRMGVGMIFAALSFFMFGAAQWQMDQQDDKTLSIFWQVPQIFTISVAEILISVTGLEFAYSQATPAMKSFITALYLMTDAIGTSVAASLFGSVAPYLSRVQIAILFACLMLLNFLIFLVVAIRFKPAEPDELEIPSTPLPPPYYTSGVDAASLDINTLGHTAVIAGGITGVEPVMTAEIEMHETSQVRASKDRREREISDYGH